MNLTHSQSLERFLAGCGYLGNGWLEQVSGQEEEESDRVVVDYSYDAAGEYTDRQYNGTSDLQAAYACDARDHLKSIGMLRRLMLGVFNNPSFRGSVLLQHELLRALARATEPDLALR